MITSTDMFKFTYCALQTITLNDIWIVKSINVKLNCQHQQIVKRERKSHVRIKQTEENAVFIVVFLCLLNKCYLFESKFASSEI